MKIVLKWSFKTLFSDIPRLLLTILNIAGVYALLMSLGILLEFFNQQNENISSAGLPYFVISVVMPPIILASFALTIFVLFVVSLTERRNQYRIMRSSGCTVRQMIYGLLTEALALDIAGAVPGTLLGFVLVGASMHTQTVYVDVSLPIHTFGSILLRFALPLFITVPVMMLAASAVLFRKPNEKRKKPKKNRKDPFRKRLFPRLFGVGGMLEYSLGKNERRHRAVIAFSVVINLSILFLMATGLALLMNSEPYGETRFNPSDVSLSYRSEKTDLHFAADIREILSEYETKAGAGDEKLRYMYVHSCGPFLAVVDSKWVSDVGIYKSGAVDSTPSHFLCTVDEDRTLLYFGFLFLDDQTFAALKKDAGIPENAKGGIWLNEHWFAYHETDSENQKRCVFREKPDSPIAFTACSKTIEENWNSIFRIESADAAVDVQSYLSKLPASGEIELSGMIDADTYYHFVDGSIYFPGVVMPESEYAAFEKILDKTDRSTTVSEWYDNFHIFTEQPFAVRERLRTELAGKGYTINEYNFGDGPEDESQDDLILRKNDDGTVETTVTIVSYTLNGESFYTFLRQCQTYYRYFAVLIFLSVALNIINIVHMNRLSRKQEYAILTSVGLGKRQKLGMLLYESICFTVRVFIAGVVTLVVIARLLLEPANTVYNSESLHLNLRFVGEDMATKGMIGQLWITAENIWYILSPYWGMVVFAFLFIFFGFIFTELIVNKKFEKEDLVLTLKDDMHE